MQRVVRAVLAVIVIAGCGGSADQTASSAPVTVTVTSTPQSTTTTGYGDTFLDWAANHKVGELDLPSLVKESPAGVTEFAKGHCPLLAGETLGTVDMVVGVVKHNTNGSSEQSLALLEKAVEASCPEKSKFLN